MRNVAAYLVQVYALRIYSAPVEILLFLVCDTARNYRIKLFVYMKRDCLAKRFVLTFCAAIYCGAY